MYVNYGSALPGLFIQAWYQASVLDDAHAPLHPDGRRANPLNVVAVQRRDVPQTLLLASRPPWLTVQLRFMCFGVCRPARQSGKLIRFRRPLFFFRFRLTVPRMCFVANWTRLSVLSLEQTLEVGSFDFSIFMYNNGININMGLQPHKHHSIWFKLKKKNSFKVLMF